MSHADVKVMLKRLDKEQLLQLAKQKRGAVAAMKDMSKTELASNLAFFVKKKDIDELNSKHGRTGDKAVIDGLLFETKCVEEFSKKGFNCKLRNVQIPHMEFDIIGNKVEKRDFGLTRLEYWIVAECKNKPRVTMRDFDKFFRKYNSFMKVKKETPDYCRGYMLTSGTFDANVEIEARRHGIKLATKR